MNLTEYFNKTAYKSQYQFGTRFFGKYQKVPFIGTGFDTLRSIEEGPIIIITLDLPLKIKNTIHHVIKVKPKDVKVLKQWQ